ncbi:glycerol-3-phosphate ABC transporter permease [Agromyces badenianii]|uniref:Glycerol-3-phosphate ABC transporter permease n=1 Tax=Agromyces badenianii TaxID=2080742 RepID=A0A2S0WZ84_9MICO|nr:sugar ABC transporter permease [Agromyces badenianii]AWB96636.1 glycerol-3-phosphate ABC transporter permease [Agromyces badenianii]PWC05553.1 sugar ABC transporter permease [Agromyces badenianii]
MTATSSLTLPQRRRGSRSSASPRFARRSLNLFYVPALAVLALFTIWPLLNGIVLSFTNWNGYSPGRSFIGLENYGRLFADPIFHTALFNTFIYGFGSTLIQQVVGLALALALDRAMRGRNVARAIIYLPVLVSPVVMGTMYYLFFSYNSGGLNDLVVALGGERTAWLSDSNTAIALIVLVNSLQFVGISMVIYLAGLQSIPVMYYEAARLDGAGALQQFMNVTVPLLQPAFATSIVLNLIGGLKLFDVIQVLTGGGPGYSTNSVSTLISTAYFDNQTAGYASAMGVALFILIAVFTLFANTMLNRKRLELQ